MALQPPTAQHLRRLAGAHHFELSVLNRVSVLAMPSTPMTAHRYNPNQSVRERIDHGWNMLANTAPFNMTGHPSISVPCGKSYDLPIGMMLTGAHFKDGTLLRVAHAFEQQMSWDKR